NERSCSRSEVSRLMTTRDLPLVPIPGLGTGRRWQASCPCQITGCCKQPFSPAPVICPALPQQCTMTAIPRHRLDPQEIRPRLEQTREAMPTFVRGARRDPNHLTLVGSNALDMAAGLSVTEPDSEEIADWVELAAQAYAGFFTVAAA